MKRKLILILIALIACASTCILIFSLVKKYAKPVSVKQPEVPKTICGEPEPSYFSGKISFYNQAYCDQFNPSCRTASGETFDDTAPTCACSYAYQLGTVFKVSYKEKSIVVRCNDRGSFEKQGRVLDMSEKAFTAIAPKSKGVVEAKIEVVYPEYDQINQYRQNQGLSKFTRNENLELSAYESAKDISEGKRGWNHDGYQAYITKHYGGWRYIGENLAKDFGTIDAVISAWHNSEKHREILQSKDYCEIGIARYKNIWVLHLGSKTPKK